MKTPPNFSRSLGFSLTEIMMVLAIVSIAIAISANYMRNPGEAHQLPAAAASSSSLFQSARALALTKGAQVRVLINNDPSDRNNFRRQIVTLFSDMDANGNEIWRMEGKFQLPAGIYFQETESRDEARNPVAKVQMVDLQFGSGPEWFCYTFAPNGGAVEPGMRFILESGVREGASEEIRRMGEHAIAGFVVRRAGQTTMFRDPEQILN
jgi:prepilin-type N-terminal cleavage/methylation domain-containing protein